MNRRQFVKCSVNAIAGLSIFGLPKLRNAKETLAALSNRSLRVLDSFGISSDKIKITIGDDTFYTNSTFVQWSGPEPSTSQFIDNSSFEISANGWPRL